MEVILKTTMCGPRGNAWPGDRLEIPDVEAAAMIHGGYASAVHAPVERAVLAIKRPVIPQPTPEVRTHGKRSR